MQTTTPQMLSRLLMVISVSSAVVLDKYVVIEVCASLLRPIIQHVDIKHTDNWQNVMTFYV